MPDVQTYIIDLTNLTLPVATVGAATPNNGALDIPVPVVYLNPVQVIGLVPMHRCGETECRCIPSSCCEKLKVFGNIVDDIPVATSTYENDLSDFIIDVQVSGSNGGVTNAAWYIDKCTGVNSWEEVAAISNNNYGTYHALGTVAQHPTYTDFTVNWAYVLNAFGVGDYRIRFVCAMRSIVGCLLSPDFQLRAWNCHLASRTVKFETVAGGTIGDCHDNGYLFSLCGLNWFSSIRIGGVFENRTVPKYDETFNKWQNGKIEHVRDEAIPKWKFKSLLLTEEYHLRLSIYMMMSVQARVSDYNIFNVAKTIRQKSITKMSSYDVEDYNTSLPPRAISSADFNSGIQNLIMSNCCNLLR